MTLALAPDKAERYATFLLGGEHYALPEDCVRAVLQEAAVTHVPAAPRFMRGALAVHGQAVPVVDLGSRLGQAFRSTAARTGVLVIEVHREGTPMLLGLTVDAVLAPVSLEPRDVVSAPSFGATHRMDSFIAGLGRHGEGLVLMLDGDRLLSASELLAAEEFAACADLGAGLRPV